MKSFLENFVTFGPAVYEILANILNLIVLVMKDLMAHMKEDNLEVSLLHPTPFLRLVFFTL